jgi:hypothetical protein
MRSHFLRHGHRKKRIGRSRLSDVLSRRMSPRTHNPPSGRLRNDFFEVDKEMFQTMENPFELILCVLCIGRIEMCKVA